MELKTKFLYFVSRVVEKSILDKNQLRCDCSERIFVNFIRHPIVLAFVFDNPQTFGRIFEPETILYKRGITFLNIN